MSESNIIFGGNAAGMPINNYYMKGGCDDIYNDERRLEGLVVPIGLIQYNTMGEPIINYKQSKEAKVIENDVFDSLFNEMKQNRSRTNKTEKTKKNSSKLTRKLK